MFHRHLTAPLFVPGGAGQNDSYHPAVLCLLCRREFHGPVALDQAIEYVKSKGLGPRHEELLRMQFARDGYK